MNFKITDYNIKVINNKNYLVFDNFILEINDNNFNFNNFNFNGNSNNNIIITVTDNIITNIKLSEIENPIIVSGTIECYAHRYAKECMLIWLRTKWLIGYANNRNAVFGHLDWKINTTDINRGVLLEYPIFVSNGKFLGIEPAWETIPDIKKCEQNGRDIFVIFDIGIVSETTEYNSNGNICFMDFRSNKMSIKD